MQVRFRNASSLFPSVPDARDQKLRASGAVGDLEPESSLHLGEALSILRAGLLGDLNSFLFAKHLTAPALRAHYSEAQLPKERRMPLSAPCKARVRWQNLPSSFRPTLMLGAQVAAGVKATVTLQS